MYLLTYTMCEKYGLRKTDFVHPLDGVFGIKSEN